MINTGRPESVSFSQAEISHAIESTAAKHPILVDFDETLLLRNSTAEYLNNLRPRFLGAFLLKVLSALKPWSWLVSGKNKEVTRDWFLIFISTVLMPWNILIWQSKARKLAERYSNLELLEYLNKNSDAEVIVASLGFKSIINPILRHMSVDYSKLIACSLLAGPKDRQRGKLDMVEEIIGAEALSNATLVTDSLDDLPVMEKVAKPLLVVWDKAKYTSPMSDVYMPMMYLHKVKRAGENYIVKSVLGDDLPILILALSWLSPQPLLSSCALLFLTLSFWCIYEVGYYENDFVGWKYEKDPTLNKEFYVPGATYVSGTTMSQWQPWLWSLLLGAIGVAFLTASDSQVVFGEDYLNHLLEASTVPFAIWALSLAGSRFCFWVYNYVNKQTRIWLYTFLQFSRYCGFLAIVASNLIGVSLLFGQILSRSISYLVYRYSGGNKENWPQLQEKFLRLVLFVLLVGGLSLAQSDISLILNWQTGAIILWCCFRGWQHVKQAVSIFGLIKEDNKAISK